MKGFLLVIGLVAVGATAATQLVGLGREDVAPVPAGTLHTARRGDLVITVTENGYLKAKNSEFIQPKFKREGTITWLVEEGEEVEQGQVLVEFDKTELENQLVELESSLLQFEIELEAARADQAIQERDNQASVETAELKLEIAELTLERYEKGEAPNELRKKTLAAEKAGSEHERALDRYEEVPELAAKGFLTKNQEEEERILLREAEINKENAARDLELYVEYTQRMELTQKRADVKDARRELENAREKAVINLKEKQVRVTSNGRQVSSTEARLAQLRAELEQLTIRSPKPGTVHYGDPARPWMHDEIKLGNRVRQGNTVITLPDLRAMQVLIQVHEADIDLVQKGMTAIVTVETHKGRSFPAEVTDIATVASSVGWTDESNRAFRVEITLGEPEPEPEPEDGSEEGIELRAGVSARVEIQVAERENVLQVPIHAVAAEGGQHFCFVHAGGKTARREVEVGEHNAHFVEITGGLEEGEEVLLFDPRKAGGSGGAPVEREAGGGSDGAGGLSSDLSGMTGAD